MAFFAKDRQLTPSWDLLPTSWGLVKKYVWQLVYISLIPSLVLTLGVILFGSFMTREGIALTTRETWGLVIFGIGAILTLITYPGYTYLMAQAVQGNEIGTLEAFKRGLSRLLPFVGATFLAAIAVAVGLILFIVPGLILIRAFYFAPYYVVDQKLGPIAALKQSMRDTKPVSAWVWGIIGVTLVFSLIASVLGIVPVFGYILSLLVAYPYVFGPALRYAEITNRLGVKVQTATFKN